LRISRQNFSSVNRPYFRLDSGHKLDQPNSPKRETSQNAGTSSRDDAQLRSFLRKAVAVIASERGLNAQSRLKLESLAQHQKLPEELFREAIRRLKENDASLESLSRYERAFVGFLEREMKKLSGDVLSLSVEQRAIELGKRKYQISGERAEQLIQQQADVLGIERISRSEAESYATKLILELIGDRTEVSEEFRDQLYSKGGKLGLDRDRVDSKILQALKRKQPHHPRWRWWGVILMTVLALTIAPLLYFGWFEPAPRPKPSPNIVQPPAVVEPELPGFRISWLSDESHQLLEKIAGEGLGDLLAPIDSATPGKRAKIYRELIDRICGEEHPNLQTLESLLSQLFIEEPDVQNAALVLQELRGYFGSGLDFRDLSMSTFRQQYRANRLLAIMYSKVRHTSAEARGRMLKNEIEGLTGVDPSNLLLTEFLPRTELEVATIQWNQLIQNCLRRPGLAASLVEPLSQLSRTKLPSETLSVFETRLVQTLIQQDSQLWPKMRSSIQSSISQANEEQLVTWIDLIVHSENSRLKQTFNPSLIERAKIFPRPRSGADTERALQNVVQSYRNRRLQPLFDRASQVDAASVRLLQTSGDGFSVRPDQIAQTIRTTCQNLELVRLVRGGDFLSPDAFGVFDDLMGRKPIRLRDLVSLPGKSRDEQLASSATASDRRRKSQSLAVLSNLNSKESSRRILALRELEKISSRFSDIDYDDAVVMARYFLTDVNDPEWINIQQTIHSFARWPNLGLAIADQIAFQKSTLDQSLTIARLFTASEIELQTEASTWPDDLSDELIRRVYERFETDARLANDTDSDWNRLELFLVEEFRNLFKCWDPNIRLQSPTNGSRSPSEILLSGVTSKAKLSTFSGVVTRKLEAGADMIRSGDFHEMEKSVLASQLLLEILEADVSQHSPVAVQRATTIRDEFNERLHQKTILAEQLYEVQLGILRMAMLMRDSAVRRLTESTD
jgi:hypothetical protein